MSRLKLDSAPTFRTSVPAPAAETKPAPQRPAAPDLARQLKTDTFEASGKVSGGVKSGNKVEGPAGSRPLSEKLEPLKGTFEEIAKKVAGDSTLDTKDKINAAIESELLKLKAEYNLSDKEFREAFREVRKMTGGYGNSDPEIGASGGYREK